MQAEELQIAELVSGFRRRVGITQAQLAGLVGLSVRSVRAIECGRVPGAAALRRITAVMERPGALSGDLARALRAATNLSVGEVRSVMLRVRMLEDRLQSIEGKLAGIQRRLDSIAPVLAKGDAA